ncbi:MAG: orotate phosphoribosyltransferase [Planctomycetota bacterium]|nr:MAG: orotate phosphoribosyltransferase [Planctomycetota bacterium]
MAFDRQELIRLFRERSLRFGEFTLASGKKSSYYLDGKQNTLYSRGLRLIAEGLLHLTQDIPFDAVGGMSIGADPIVGGVLAVAAARDRDLVGFLVRKEPKGHGTQRFIEGPLEPGMRCVIIDDVITTGGSALTAARRVQEFGGVVVCCAGVVDRMEGGAEAFAAAGLPFRSLLTIEDFDISPPSV